MRRIIVRRMIVPAVLLLLPAFGAGAAVETEAELERIRALVAAGALPRKALAEAEKEFLESGHRAVLRATLLKQTLSEAEVPAMLAAAKALRDLAQENLELVVKQVAAGVLPANQLPAARDALDAARRKLELSESRAEIVRELARMASAETRFDELEEEDLAYRFDGFDLYEMDALHEIDEMYFESFGDPPPISAEGDTEFHRSIGLDHTGRVDIALHPDSEEGVYLTFLLEGWGIPYIAFRSAVPGQATGPHIHVGPPSGRIRPGADPRPAEDLEGGDDRSTPEP